MPGQTAVEGRSTKATTGSVTSRDGTTIGYRRIGAGPAVVLLHGAMESSQSHLELAEALATRFTVYAPDRRGRGLSGPFGAGYSIRKEVEDLDALLTETGAHDVFGVSAGAVICLQAALTLPAIRRVAIFEPALVVDGSLSMAFLSRYDEEIAQGKVASALVTGMLGSQMGPPIFNIMPRWLLERLTAMFMASEEKKATGDSLSMRALAPTLHYDFQLILEMEPALQTFRSVRAEVLLLGGSRSPRYLKIAADAVEKVLPHVTRIEFGGLDHGASGPSDRGGRPELVAQRLREFFV
jgi:pimeloyl-ACP methyl ester carboxylesterase